jgi:hypothetical protein
MSKKRLLLISIVACIILIGGIFTAMFFREKPAIIIELAIYGNASIRGQYFTLDDKGVLRSYYGERYGYRLTSERSSKYMERVQLSSRKRLSEEELSNLMNMIDHFNSGWTVEFHDGSVIEFLYKDIYIRDRYPVHGLSSDIWKTSPFHRMVREILRLSGFDDKTGIYGRAMRDMERRR